MISGNLTSTPEESAVRSALASIAPWPPVEKTFWRDAGSSNAPPAYTVDDAVAAWKAWKKHLWRRPIDFSPLQDKHGSSLARGLGALRNNRASHNC